MISFRYHVVSLVAVLLALAVGVALGGGPLSDIGRDAADADSGQHDNQQLVDDLDQAELVAGFQDDVNASLGSATTRNALKGRTVSVVALPGADPAVVKALGEQVKRASGSVVGSYAVTEAMLALDGSSLVDTLGAQLAEGNQGAAQPGASTYVRMGQLIRRAIAVETPRGVAADKPAQNIRSGLEAAKLFTTSAGGTNRGSLVLVVLGDDDPEDGVDKIVGGLVTGMARGSNGVVVTAPTDASLLDQVRGNAEVTKTVSTVDSVQTRSGQLAAVLALSAEATGGPGSYGVHGKDGAIPRG